MIRTLLNKCWLLFALLTILVAVLFTIVRLLMPFASEYKEEILQTINERLGKPIIASTLEAEWRGLGPYFVLYDVALLDKETGQKLIQFDNARIDIDIIGSVLAGEMQFGSLTVIGIDLTIQRNADNSITVEGFKKEAQQSDNRDPSLLLKWFLSQSHLAIEANNVIWQDFYENSPLLRFSNVNLNLGNEGDRHQLDGSALLPDSLGERLTLALDIKGDLLTPGGWGGQGYVSAGGLIVDQWLKNVDLAGYSMDKGLAEIRLWSEWDKSRLIKLETELSSYAWSLSALADNSMPGENKIYAIDAISGRFLWQQQQNGWVLAADNFIVAREGKFWPASHFSIAVTDIETSQNVAANLGYIDLGDVGELLSNSHVLNGELKQTLNDLRPDGILKDMHLFYQSGDSQGNKIQIRTYFEDLFLNAGGKLPGVQGLDGHLEMDEQSGVLDFDTRDGKLKLDYLFDEPFNLDVLSGRVQWHRHDGSWSMVSDDLVIANEDIKARAKLVLEIPQDDNNPFMDLAIHFASDSIKNKSRYLPAKKMPAAALAWLDQSIVAGKIPDGAVVFHGYLKDFPFDEGQGKFEAGFELKDGELDYASGWPGIKKIDANVIFRNRAMNLSAASARSLDADLADVEVVIKDLAEKPPMLVINGKARGNTQTALDFLEKSPLKDRFGKYVADAKATGKTDLELGVVKPLSAEPARVDGKLTFENSNIYLMNGELDLTRIDGMLGFTEAGLSARAIKARVLGFAAVIDVETRVSDESVTYFTAHGKADAEGIRKILPIPLMEHIEGENDWSAVLKLTGQKTDGQSNASLFIDSYLEGLAVNLPEPIGKDARTPARLFVEMDFPRAEDWPIKLRYGDEFSAIFDLDEKMKLERGELRFGEGVAQLPDEGGLRVVGQSPGFSLTEWLSIMNPPEGVGEEPSGVGINNIDMQFSAAEAHHRYFTNVTVKAVRKGNIWKADVKSDEMTGKLQIPLDNITPLVMDLDYLRLVEVSQERKDEENEENPVGLPAALITSKQFLYGQTDFGRLDLKASKRDAGLHLDHLRLDSPVMKIEAKGDWVKVGDEHYSSFNIHFNSEDLGEALSKMGYSGSLKKGRSEMGVIARWSGPPTAFALEHLDGNMHLKIERGRLLEVDPGAGRIFGLISLQALPRRLILDFSDVFQSGFSFDLMEGDFAFKDGNARTSNLFMEGPSARIEANGRVGLAEKDYDQIVTVTPHITSGLPVAGAVMGGLGVGAAIMLMEKLIKPGVDKAAKIKYSVKGAWDNPEITQLDTAR